MAQATGHVYRLLTPAAAYQMFQSCLGAARSRRILVDDYIRPKPGDRVLDIGCGPADILEFLPGVTYVGFDLSPEYIERARQRWGAAASFECIDIDRAPTRAPAEFEIVMAVGVLHHLDDREAAKVFDMAANALRPGGRLITVDPVFADGQSWAARRLIGLDRGRNVRTEAAYLALARARFPGARSEIRHDLVRIPYSHCILQCSR